MITELTVERFKCWHTTQSFKLAPLTVFFGETGTGKSTVGHFLTLLKQTVTTSDSSVVLYPGDPDSILPLGTYGSLLHKHERSGGLRFSYRWQLPEYLEVVDTTEYTAEGRPSQYQIANEMMFNCHVNFNTANHPFVQTISYQLYDNNKKGLSITSNRTEIAVNTRSAHEKITTQYAIEIDGYQLKNRTGRPWLQQPPKHFYGFSDELASYYKNISFAYDINRAHENLLNNIYYIGTNRADYHRLHVWSGIHRFDVGKNGSHTITTMLGAQHRNISLGQRKRNQSFVKTIEMILQRLNLAQGFNVETIDNIEHGFEIRLQSNNKINLDLTEGGSAILQVLPILVQCFCAPPNSIIVIDAPETHLHPLAQRILAEVLVEVTQSREDSQDRNIQLIISTQSEQLLNGLQDQILMGNVPAENIQAYHTSTGRKYAHVSSINLTEGRTRTDLHSYFVEDTTFEILEELPTATTREIERPDADKWNIKVDTKVRKKRGRPKGSKNKPKITSTNKATSMVTPKKRGRPKGSKNKPKT